jgi:putative inorganic carbon (hco3(-)) transporter
LKSMSFPKTNLSTGSIARELSRGEKSVVSALHGNVARAQDSLERLRGSLTSAFVTALFSPLTALRSSLVQRILLAVVLLDLPFQFGTHLFYSEQDAAFGALGGLSLSATTIALVGLYLSWFFLPLANRSRKAKAPHHFNLPLVVFLAATAVSVFAASDVSLALYELFLAVQLYLAYFYVANHLRRHEDIQFVVCCLLIGCLIESAAMIVLEFTGMPSTIWGLPTHIHLQTGIHDAFVRVGGTVGSPNEASAYLSLLLPLAACLLLAGMPYWQKWLACLVLGFGGVAMIFTYSRGGWIALVLAAILVSFVLVRTRGISLKALIAILVLLIILYLPFHGVISARAFGDDQGSAESRIPLTMLAFRMIADHPVLGVGANNFSVVMQRYLTSYFRTGFLYVVHNKYLLIWTETGIGGLLAYLAFLIGAVRRGWQCWKQNDGYLSMLALGITAAMVGQIVHMNFDVFRIGPVPELLWLLAGLLIPIDRIGAAGRARGGVLVLQPEGPASEALVR